MLKKVKKLLLISLIIINIQIVSFARYYETLDKIQGYAVIAEPIVKLESLQDTIQLEINKETERKEYYFIIKNYEIDSKNNKRISEVDFSYDIEIEITDNNFPIKYELYDISTNEKIQNKSKFDMPKNIEFEKKYKLVIYWNDLQEEMSNKADINIKVNVSQKENLNNL